MTGFGGAELGATDSAAPDGLTAGAAKSQHTSITAQSFAEVIGLDLQAPAATHVPFEPSPHGFGAPPLGGGLPGSLQQTPAKSFVTQKDSAVETDGGAHVGFIKLVHLLGSEQRASTSWENKKNANITVTLHKIIPLILFFISST